MTTTLMIIMVSRVSRLSGGDSGLEVETETDTETETETETETMSRTRRDVRQVACCSHHSQLFANLPLYRCQSRLVVVV